MAAIARSTRSGGEGGPPVALPEHEVPQGPPDVRPEEPSQLQRLLDSEPPKRAGWVSSGKKRNRQKRW